MVLCGSQDALGYRFAGIHILAICYCAKKEATHHRAEQKEFLHIQFILEITNQSSPAASLRQREANGLKTKRKASFSNMAQYLIINILFNLQRYKDYLKKRNYFFAAITNRGGHLEDCRPCKLILTKSYALGERALVSISSLISAMKSASLAAPLSPALRFHTDTTPSSDSF